MKDALVIVALVAGACGGKKTEAPHADKAAVEKYLNVDMGQRFAELFTARRPFAKLPPDVFEKGTEGFLDFSMPDVITRLTSFIDNASKVTPPASLATTHTLLLDVAAQYRDIAKAMLAAYTAKDPAAYKKAHERMLEESLRYERWAEAQDKVLAETKAVWNDVPEPPPLPEAAPPPKPTYCGEQPCPCKPGSEVKAGDKLSSCELTAPLAVQTFKCAAGKVAFYPDGAIRSCMHAQDDWHMAGEKTFHPNGRMASANSGLLAPAYMGISCGPGPGVTRWFDDGSYEACPVHTGSSASTINGVELPARTKGDAYAAFYKGGKPRYVKVGTVEKCWDAAGAPVEPCAAPTW